MSRRRAAARSRPVRGRAAAPASWDAATGKLRYRTDATAKVTGEKIFSIDMRSRDLPGWPQEQSHAMLLRVTRADHAYAGFDLSALGDELRPDRVVTAADLARDGVAFPPFYGEDMLLPEGRTPAYLGHAVAVLVWHDFARFRAAKTQLKVSRRLDPLGRSRPVRSTATLGELPLRARRRRDAVRRRYLFEPEGHAALPGGLPQAGAAVAAPSERRARRAGHGARRGDRKAARHAGDRAALVLEREYFSQSIDTAAFELDNGNGWYDRVPRRRCISSSPRSRHRRSPRTGRSCWPRRRSA